MHAKAQIEKAVTTGPLDNPYEVVEKACSFIAQHWREQPSLERLARELGYSPSHLHRCFTRWAGISPKEFIASLNIQKARAMLEEGQTLLETSLEIGLSSPSRLHDLFITRQAMSPGAYKMRGEGLSLNYGFCQTLFGTCLLILHEGHIAGLSFCDRDTKEETLQDMRARWPKAEFTEAAGVIAQKAGVLFRHNSGQPIKLVLIGSDFDISVWEALTHIPAGSLVTYSDIAKKLGKPKAVRAVASSVGRNPVSYYVPCHRVLRRGGMLGGYHWGLSRKCALIGWENSAKT